MKRLKTSFLYHSLIDHIYILIIPVILLIYTITKKDFIYLICLLIILFILLLINKKIFIFTIIISLIITINIYIRYKITKNYSTIFTNELVQVIKVNQKENKDQIIIRKGLNKYISYVDKEFKINAGTKLIITGIRNSDPVIHTPGGFDYYTYLINQQISGVIELSSVKIKSKGFSIYSINEYCNNYFDKVFNNIPTNTKGFLKALIIGNKNDIDETVENSISQIGIGHLFVISGLHMGIIVGFISFILKRLHVNDNYQFIIIIFFLVIYYLIVGLMISILRLIINRILSYINKKYILHFSNLDIYLINVLIVLLINPYLLTQISALLTYLITIMIVIISPLLTKRKGAFLINNLIISTCSLIITIPVVMKVSPEINLLSIIFNLFYIPVVSYILLPLSLLVTFLPFLSNIYNYIVVNFTNLTVFLNQLSFGKITIPQNYINTSLYNLVYFLLIYFLYYYLKKKRYKNVLIFSLSLITLIISTNIITIINTKNEVVFVDLPVGEATLIKESYQKNNILIDTGEANYTDLINYLQNEGVKTLNSIIISHGDTDHIGLLPTILKKFKVKHIYISKYDPASIKYINQLTLSNKIKIHLIARGDWFKLGKATFKVIWPYQVDNKTNNNSLVFITNFNNHSYLFTGDIEAKVEKELIKLEPIINIDILKVAHHGSNTSSTKLFLNHIKYKLAIGMNGYYNIFSFPHPTTINNLLIHPVYFTKDRQTIIIAYLNCNLKCNKKCD